MDEALTTLAIFDGPGQALRLATVPRPEAGPGEARVAVLCSTICGSDLHTVRGDRPVAGPTVLGHEIVGTIEALGAGGVTTLDGSPLVVGDRVTWSVVVPCGKCRACRRGRPEHCTRRFKYGHARVDAPNPCTGGFATHCLLVARTAIARVPDGLADGVAASASCAGATICAALDAAGDVAGDRVAIWGAGLLGLCAVAFAKARGAASVVVVDTRADRLERARAFGADETVIAGRSDALGDVDVGLELSGALPATESAVRSLVTGGRLVLVGAVFPGPALEVDPEDLIRRRLRITGVHNYEARHLVSALDALAESPAPFAELIAAPIPLAEADRAMQLALEGEHLRVAIRP